MWTLNVVAFAVPTVIVTTSVPIWLWQVSILFKIENKNTHSPKSGSVGSSYFVGAATSFIGVEGAGLVAILPVFPLQKAWEISIKGSTEKKIFGRRRAVLGVQ